MPGRIGADYEIIRELRRGPWVTVYEARHRVLGRRTLVKWLNPEHKNDEEMAGRLKREARLGASVDHINAARIYGVGEAEGRPFVAIEWIEGEDLETLLKREGGLPFERVLRLARDLMAGLEAIHEAGVTHRDLSPTNVRMTANGVARITDFGLATGAFDPRYTLPGSVVGTPGYLAPEQASGKEADLRADLFALGVLIYEALTAKTLFRDKDLISTLKRVRTQPAPPLDSVMSSLPVGFSRWVDKLLQKDPEERYQNVKEARDALETIKLEAKPDEDEERPVESAPKMVIPARLLPAMVGGLLLAIIIVVGYQMVQLQRKPIEPPGLVMQPDEERALRNTKDTLTAPKQDPMDPDRLKPGMGEQNLPGVRTTRTGQPVDDVKEDAPGVSSPPLPEQADQIAQKGGTDEFGSGAGVLIVRTRPWADVLVDGEKVGATPSLRALKRPAGNHTITLQNPGFPEISLDTTVYADDTTLVTVNLLDRLGYLAVIAQPWAKVFIDDAHVGDTPAFRHTLLLPGPHRLRLSHPEFGEVVREITLAAGDTLHISINMSEEGTAFAATEE